MIVASEVTIDIDHYERNHILKAHRAYHGLKQAGAQEVEVAISSGGLGLHIRGKFSERLSDEQKDSLRRTLCDDPKRIHMDVERRRAGSRVNQVMWHEKDGNTGTRETRFQTLEDALGHIEKTRRTDYERVHALAQHGRKGVWEHEGINRASLIERDGDC